ncbi:MAG: hypothetical protein LBP20_04815 [Treponema sp.]|jgi:hypothetical protein|nr:hypothetical protein [Treponema sp.]
MRKNQPWLRTTPPPPVTTADKKRNVLARYWNIYDIIPNLYFPPPYLFDNFFMKNKSIEERIACSRGGVTVYETFNRALGIPGGNGKTFALLLLRYRSGFLESRKFCRM